jgi:hypothetical protein
MTEPIILLHTFLVLDIHYQDLLSINKTVCADDMRGRWKTVTLLYGCELISILFYLLYPRKKSPGTHLVGGRAGRIVGRDVLGEENLFLLPKMEPQFLGCPDSILVPVPTALSRLLCCFI